MDFSNIFSHSNIVEYCPSGDLICIATGHQAIIVETASLHTMHKYDFEDVITKVEWSPSNHYIAFIQAKRGLVDIKSLADYGWYCKISQGIVGLNTAKWVPNGYEILTVSSYMMRATIWDLRDKSTQYIEKPKYPEVGIEFDTLKRTMGILQRLGGKDFLSIYKYSPTWSLVAQIPLDTLDAQSIKWTFNHNLVVFDTHLQVFTPEGNLLHTFEPYTKALGIKKVAMTGGGHHIGIGSYDQSLRTFNCLSWKMTAQFKHKPFVGSSGVRIYVEKLVYNEGLPNSYKYVMEKSFNVAQSHVDSLKKLPLGVGLVEWSHDCKFIATKNENMPNAVWIWSTEGQELHSLIIQMDRVTSLAWCPNGPTATLAFSSNNSKIYLWNQDGASLCQIPVENKMEFEVQKIKWNPTGKNMTVIDKDNLALAFPN